MVAPGSQDASITFTMRLRDQVSQAMGRVESSFNRVGTAAGNATRFLAQNAEQMATIGVAIIAASGPMVDLAENMGLLNEEQKETAQGFLQVAGAIAGFLGPLAQVGTFILGRGAVQRSLAQLSAALLAAGGVAAGFLAAASAGLAFAAALQSIRGELPPVGAFLERLGVPSPQIIPTETGRRIGRTPVAGGGAPNLPGAAPGSGTQIAFNVGTLVADEIGLREFSKRIGRILQEEARIGGFRIT